MKLLLQFYNHVLIFWWRWYPVRVEWSFEWLWWFYSS